MPLPRSPQQSRRVGAWMQKRASILRVLCWSLCALVCGWSLPLWAQQGEGPLPGQAQPRPATAPDAPEGRSEEHTSELQSRENLVCRLLLEKKKEYKFMYEADHCRIYRPA